MKVYIVQQQDQHGSWDMTGAAFVDEARCRAYVRKEEAELIVEYLGDSEMAELLPDFDFDENEDDKKELVAAILARDPQEITEFVEEKVRMGGVFSWETVEVKDLPNEAA